MTIVSGALGIFEKTDVGSEAGSSIQPTPSHHLRSPKCGALTKAGAPCRGPKIPGRKRCKWHGGCSTGPRTPAGKAKVTANLPRARHKP